MKTSPGLNGAFGRVLPGRASCKPSGRRSATCHRDRSRFFLAPKREISQQHGFVHAGAVSAIADTAAGYAALSMMPPDRGVLTTEFKINLLAPATGECLVARGRVVKAGRTLTLAQSEVFARADGKLRLVALLTATLMAVEGRDGIAD